MSDENDEKPSELAILYPANETASGHNARLRLQRGQHLGGLKAVAAQAFKMIDQYEDFLKTAKGKDRLIALKGKERALAIALEASQEKRDILRGRKNKYKQETKDKQKVSPQDSLIEARRKMADRQKES